MWIFGGDIPGNIILILNFMLIDVKLKGIYGSLSNKGPLRKSQISASALAGDGEGIGESWRPRAGGNWQW